MIGLDATCDTKVRRFGGEMAPGDPWRKMSEADLNALGGRARASARAALDPWIKIPASRPEPARDRASHEEAEQEPRRENTSKRGKLERRSPVRCESCGNESCECWRARSPGCPRTPRLQRAAASLGAQCTCEGAGRSPRLSPQRLSPRAPMRALSAEAQAPGAGTAAGARRLYKSASQRALSPRTETSPVVTTTPPPPPHPSSSPDPLLETTC